MSTKARTCAFSAALFALMSMSGSLWAQDPLAAGGGGTFGASLRKMISGQIGRFLVLRSELDVTAEQKAEIRGIVGQYKPQIGEVAQDLKRRRRALREAVRAEKSDQGAIRLAADELGKAIGDAAVLASEVIGQSRQVLTEQQRDRVQQFMKTADQSQDSFFKEVFGQE